MDYFEDLDLKYRDNITKELRAYNIKHTGIRDCSNEYFYALCENKLVGAIETNLFWDWVDIGNMFYDHTETLENLIFEIKLYYDKKAIGIKFITEIESRVEEFKRIGFNVIGEMKGTPKTNKSFHLSSVQVPLERNKCTNVIVSTEKNVEYELILLNQIEKFNKENSIHHLEEKDMIFVAEDNHKFAGGIQLSVVEDSMYINRLVVTEEYRGQQVGTKLLKIIEEKARSLGIHSISVGTVEFQAREFYEKQGYTVMMIKENEPKGFNSYKMTKLIAKANAKPKYF